MERSSGTPSRGVAGSVASMLVVVASTLVGCSDVAQPKYSECVAAEAKGDILAAAEACEAAVKADATSKSGKAAADKLKEMQPAVVKAKKNKADAEAKAAEERRKAEEAAAKARSEEAAKRISLLREKVKRTRFLGEEGPDGECVGKSLPPYRRQYEGGTYAEDDEVAFADGCKKLHRSVELRDYCCPKP
jgi:hypothetical protein